MKYLILIGDGMGDHPVPELDGKTPLQAARTPAMDELSRKGTLLSASTVPEGFPPGSDVANMSLLGYAPQHYYTGRAPLEAASMGVILAPDETAFRCNLVTLDYHDNNRTTMVDFSAGHISNAESAQLISALQEKCGNEIFTFHAGISYRHLLVVKDPIPEMTTVPPHDFIGKDISQHFQNYLDTSGWKELLLEAKDVLAGHPVNVNRIRNGQRPATGIWPWGEGKMPSMPTLPDRFKVTGTMISAVDLLKGLGVCVNLSVAEVEGATGYIDTNYQGKAQAALDALETQDLVFVHLEGPDEAGHQARLDHKIQAIEDFDAKIVSPIVKHLQDKEVQFRAMITMDHFTPLALQTHTSEPVPVILYDSRESTPGSQLPFDETVLKSHETKIQKIEGYKLINTLLQQPESN
jgi:2,3-bisphosphoglycerate-independent phosphoglycerate mutase